MPRKRETRTGTDEWQEQFDRSLDAADQRAGFVFTRPMPLEPVVRIETEPDHELARTAVNVTEYIFAKCGTVSGDTNAEKSEWMAKAASAERRWMDWKGCCGLGCQLPSGLCSKVNLPFHLARRFLLYDYATGEGVDEKFWQKYASICPKFISEKVGDFMNQLIETDKKIEDARRAIANAQGDMERAVAYAKGIKTLKAELDKSKDDIMALQGTPIGYVVDKSYEWPTVSNALTEGILRGFHVIGNEINIIAGRFYGAQSGYIRLVRECPGVTDISTRYAVPVLDSEKRSLVQCEIAFKINGHPVVIRYHKTDAGDFRMPIRVNSGMGDDAIIGKATRKLYKKAYEHITGNVVIDADDEGDEPKTSDVVQGVVVPPPAKLEQPAELSEDDSKYLAEVVHEIDLAASVGDLTAIYKMVETKRPSILGQVKSLCGAKRKVLEKLYDQETLGGRKL